MEKTGWVKLENKTARGRKATCRSCQKTATKTVTFEDNYGKVVVSLCDECAKKDYHEILTQGRLTWLPEKDAEV